MNGIWILTHPTLGTRLLKCVGVTLNDGDVRKLEAAGYTVSYGEYADAHWMTEVRDLVSKWAKEGKAVL